MSNSTRIKTILILAANPTSTLRLRLDEEIREIDEGLRRANKREQFRLEQKWAVRSRDFYRAILDYSPQIVHFSGHGAGQDGIILEDEMGESVLVKADVLASMFKLFATKGVECVLLNACYSQVQAEAISQHVNYVIGMNQAVGDKAAQAFAVAFYDAVAAGESVEFAYELGCSVMMNFMEHHTPVLRKKELTTSVCSLPESEMIPPNPYQGLAAFGEEDAAFFFGRETFVNSLLEATHKQPLVAVVGPSGSGKSSVVFAGLVPQLQETGGWLIEVFRPGNQPLYQLASALVRQLEPELSETAQLREAAGLAADMHQGKVTLLQIVSRLMERNLGKRLLLVADQFEELYTLCQDKGEQERFADELLAAIHQKSVTLVFTLRADFYGYVLSYRPFRDALQQFTPQLLSSMSHEELRAAIEQPAQKLEVQLEAQLTQRILDDVGKEPGNLPLLEFALTRLWDKQQNRVLTHTAYDEIGGVKKALANHAEYIYNQLSETEQKQAQRIFLQLVHPGEGTEDTRRIATRVEVGNQNWGLVSYLAGHHARLVVTGRNEQSQEETVEVVHEALIREWVTLREWMNLNRQFRIWQERLKIAIQEWETSDRDPGLLLRGVALTVAEDWLQKRQEELTLPEQNFIQAGINLRDREKRQRNLALLGRTAILTIVSSLVVWGWWTLDTDWKNTSLVTKSANVETLLGKNNFEAMREAIAIGRQLQEMKRTFRAKPEIRIRVAKTLQQAVYAVKESKSLAKHTDGVIGVSFSPDGQILASASADKTVKLWNKDGTLITSLNGHRDRVTEVAWSPDGQTLASASADKTVRLWKKDGTLIYTFLKHRDRVTGVVWSPDGQTLASASWDKTVKLWKKDGTLIYTFNKHRDRVTGIAWSRDGQTLASASWDKTVKLWKKDGTLIDTLSGHSDRVTGVAWSRDGQTLASASKDTTVKLWNKDGTVTANLTGHSEQVLGVAWSPDSQTLASVSRDTKVKLWKKDGTLIATLSGHIYGVSRVAWSPDGQTLVSASGDTTVKLWKKDGSLIANLAGHSDEVLGVAWSPDGLTLASASWDKTIKLWKKQDTLSTALGKHNDRVYGVTWSPDGQTLASASADKTVKLWNKDGTVITTFTGHNSHNNKVYGVAWSPNGQTLASASQDKTVKLWKKDGNLITTLTGHKDAVYSVAWSPDGQILASGSWDKTVKLWKKDGTLITILTGHKDAVYGVAWSPDGQTLASASQDKTVKLWKKDGELIITLIGHSDAVSGVAWSPDGQTLASASLDKTVRLWRKDRTLITIFTEHSREVWSVTWSPDSQILASGSMDKTVKLWRKDGTLITSLTDYSDSVVGVAWSADGQTLASGSLDKTVKLQNLNLDDLVAQGCNWMHDYLKNISYKSDRQLCYSNAQ